MSVSATTVPMEIDQYPITGRGCKTNGPDTAARTVGAPATRMPLDTRTIATRMPLDTRALRAEFLAEDQAARAVACGCSSKKR